jgi:hypothetical protein
VDECKSLRGGAAAARPYGADHARAGGAAVAGRGAGLGSPSRAEDTKSAAPVWGVLHVRRAAGLGQGERVPVGQGLTLVHFSAQTEPFLITEATSSVHLSA